MGNAIEKIVSIRVGHHILKQEKTGKEGYHTICLFCGREGYVNSIDQLNSRYLTVDCEGSNE